MPAPRRRTPRRWPPASAVWRARSGRPVPSRCAAARSSSTRPARSTASRCPRGDRVAIITNSGGTGVELADLLADEGLVGPRAVHRRCRTGCARCCRRTPRRRTRSTSRRRGRCSPRLPGAGRPAGSLRRGRRRGRRAAPALGDRSRRRVRGVADAVGRLRQRRRGRAGARRAGWRRAPPTPSRARCRPRGCRCCRGRRAPPARWPLARAGRPLARDRVVSTPGTARGPSPRPRSTAPRRRPADPGRGAGPLRRFGRRRGAAPGRVPDRRRGAWRRRRSRPWSRCAGWPTAPRWTASAWGSRDRRRRRAAAADLLGAVGHGPGLAAARPGSRWRSGRCATPTFGPVVMAGLGRHLGRGARRHRFRARPAHPRGGPRAARHAAGERGAARRPRAGAGRPRRARRGSWWPRATPSSACRTWARLDLNPVLASAARRGRRRLVVCTLEAWRLRTSDDMMFVLTGRGFCRQRPVTSR